MCGWIINVRLLFPFLPAQLFRLDRRCQADRLGRRTAWNRPLRPIILRQAECFHATMKGSRMKAMRFSATMTALGFLLVAIAAGIWPSWALASSLPAAHPQVAAESSTADAHPAFRPCYSAARTAGISCFPQLAPPQNTAGLAPSHRHCIPAAAPHAMKIAAREAELRPPRPVVFP